MKNLIALIISMLFTNIALSGVNSDYIPERAFTHRDTIKVELDKYFPYIPEYNYIPSLIEHESCISLKHSRCWKSTSTLSTQRELGIGLGQITKAYRADGSVRFDSLQAMRDKYLNELKEAKWETIQSRPDIQIRMIVLMSKDNYKTLYNIKDPMNRLAMADASYNAGIGNVIKKRRACGLRENCDPQIWFGNVEKECIGLTKALYGNRSACDIVTHHVHDVMEVKIPKYKKQYFTESLDYRNVE